MPLKIVGFFPSNASIGKRINEIRAADVPELGFLGGEYRTGKLVFSLVDGVNKPFFGVYPARCSNELTDPVGERTVVTGKFPPRLGVHQEVVIKFQRHVDRPNSKETVLPLTVSLHDTPQ